MTATQAAATRDAGKKGVRTTIQGGAAVVILEAIDAFNIVDLTTRQYAVLLVILGGIIAFVQNVTENKVGWGFLKNVPAEALASAAPAVVEAIVPPVLAGVQSAPVSVTVEPEASAEEPTEVTFAQDEQDDDTGPIEVPEDDLPTPPNSDWVAAVEAENARAKRSAAAKKAAATRAANRAAKQTRK